MRTRTLSLLIGGFALAAVSFAADITGKWTAMVPGRNGEMETTFTFKQEGEKLSGTMKSEQGEVTISEGKVTGDSITFSVETQRGKRTFNGTAAGGELKLKREGGQGQAREFVAKKAQS